MTKFQEFARKNYKPGDQRDEMWHPEIIAECDVIDQEAIEAQEKAKAKKRADRERIQGVVEKTADINADLAGRIVVKVGFAGSHPKTKKLTADEKRLVMRLPDDVKSTIGGDKPLFVSPEYDALMKFISDRRDAFARFGIPHIQFEAAHVTDINNIPDIEELAAKTEKELPEKVAEFIAKWPDAIKKAEADLGPLFNKNDYAPAEALEKAFKFNYNWMAFGVPEELKQFNPRIYAKAKAKAEAVWREIEAQGVALLRTTIAELTAGLVESLSPKENGERRKFYQSSVTKVQDFVASFKRRNICNDEELDAEVKRLESIVSGLDLKKMSSDQQLRETVRTQMAEVKINLDSLLVSSNARMITYED